MTTQYTPILKLALPVQGELSGTWGDVVNDNITSMIEQAIAGRLVINTWSSNSHTLTTANGTTAEARAAMLSLTDSNTQLGAAGTVVCPALSKTYIVKNGAGQIITVKTASGSGIAIPNGKTMLVYCDGTNVLEGVDHVVTLSAGTLTITGLTTFASLKGADATTVTGILDEDNMNSNSNVKLATQQSIKAYVDAQVGSFDTLAEVLANGNTTGGADIVASTDDKVQFRDAAIYINSGADGHLDVVADTEVQIVTSTLNVDAAVDLSSTLVLAGNADFNGDLDVDGVTNLDVVDIDGAVNMGTTLLVTGNVDFNGDLDVDGTTNLDVVDIDGAVDMASTLTMSAGGTISAGGANDLVLNAGASGTPDIYLQSASSTKVKIEGSTGAATFSDDITLGGTTHRVWGSGYNTVQLDTSAMLYGNASSISTASNLYYNSGWKHVATGAIGINVNEAGYHTFYTGPSGSAGAAASFSNRLSINPTGNITINEDGADADFRIESDVNAQAVFVNGENSRVGLGTSSPESQLHSRETADTANKMVIDHVSAGNSWGGYIESIAGANQGLVIGRKFNASYTPVISMNVNGQSTFAGDLVIPNQIIHTGDTDTYMQFHQANGWRVVTANLERFHIEGASVVFNSDGYDADFRVESDAYASMLFIDGGNNCVSAGGGNSPAGSNWGFYAEGQTKDTSSNTYVAAKLAAASYADTGEYTTMLGMGVEKSAYWSKGGIGYTRTTSYDVGYLGFYVNGTTSAANLTLADEVLRLSAAEVIVNDRSRSTVDFRVESDGNANMLFVDAGNNRIGVGTGTPNRSFQVESTLSANIVNFHYLNVVSAYKISGGTATRNVRVEFGSGGEYYLKMYIVGLWAYEGAGYGTVTIEVAGFGGEERVTVIDTTKTAGGATVTANVSADNNALNIQISSTQGSWRWSAMTEMVHGPSGAYVTVDGTDG